MATQYRKSKFCWHLSLFISFTIATQAFAGDIDPSNYQPFKGGRFFLLTNGSFSSSETATVRLEAPGRKSALAAYSGVDVVVYRVKDPISFLKNQKNLHRPQIKGAYKGEGVSNALSYLWDSWYKKSRLVFQRILSYEARKKAVEIAPELKQVPAHTYQTRFSNRPQFEQIPGFDFIDKFRYPMWHAKPIGPPAQAHLSGSSSNFIEPKDGNVYIPIGKRSPGLYYVEAIIGTFRANTMVFVSDTVAITKTAAQQLFIWTANKQSGVVSPKSKILVTDGVGVLKSGTTDESGMLSLDLNNPEKSYIMGQDDNGGVFVSENFYFDSEIYDTKIYAFTDRPLYRPGDEVHLKILGRVFEDSRNSKTMSAGEISIAVLDPNTTPVVVQKVKVENPSKGADTSFRLPSFAASGGYSIEITKDKKVYTSAFRVSQYTKPHYEIDVQLSKSDFKTGEAIKGKIQLRYSNSDPVKDARVDLSVRAQPLTIVEGELQYLGKFPVKLTESKLSTNSNGNVKFEIPAAEKPSRYILQIRTVDNTSYRVTSTKEIMIDAGASAFAVETKSQFTKPGEIVTFHVRHIEGEKPQDKLKWVSIRLEDQSEIDGSVDGDAFKVNFEKSGTYALQVRDAQGKMVGSVSHWVEGPDLKGVLGSVALVLDKKEYLPGDTARLLMAFSEEIDEALLTLERDKTEQYALLSKPGDWIKIKKKSNLQWQAEIPVKEFHAPNVTFSIAYVKNGNYVFQNKGLKVAIPQIDLVISPDKSSYKPGEMVQIDLKTMLGNKPVSAELSVGVVDEMVYVLQPEIAPVISDFFFHIRRNQVRTSSSLAFHTYDAATSATGALDNSNASYYERPLKLRERPRRENIDTAFWAPNISTNASGKASIKFKMPDSLTRWRITVRAMSKDGVVGQKKSYIKSTQDVYLKWTGPLTYRKGDQAKLNLVAFNLSQESTSVNVRAKGLGVDTSKKYALEPGSNHVVIDAPLNSHGTLNVSLESKGKQLDSLSTDVDVLPSNWLTQSVETVSLKSKDTSIAIPKHAFNVRLALVSGLSDSFLKVTDSLISYPYGCVEQTSSRLIPAAMALENLQSLGLSNAFNSRLRNIIETSRLRLVQMAGPNAVFGWWGDMTGDSPFMTAYAYYADWNSSNVLGYKLPAGHWDKLLEVYKDKSGRTSTFERAIVLWLASEMKLPVRSLIEGLGESFKGITLPEYNASSTSKAVDTSYVLYSDDEVLRDSMAIYLTSILAKSNDASLPPEFSSLNAGAESNLSRSDVPLARALLLMGKSGKILPQDRNLVAGKTLFDLSTSASTVDRALGLIAVGKAVNFATKTSSQKVMNTETWKLDQGSLSGKLWRLRSAASDKVEVKLKEAPAQDMYANLIYDSYKKENNQLPVQIERKLYKLTQRDKALEFDVAEVAVPWATNAAELYVDEIKLTPQQGAEFKFGIIEVPLPPGADVESTTWGIKIAGFDGKVEPQAITEARNQSGKLFYAVPVEVLNQPITIRHLVRFGQTGTFKIPQTRYYRMYAPQEKAYASKNEPTHQTVSVQ